MRSAATVVAESVTVIRSGRRVLTGVSLAPAPGTLTAVSGPSGAGKSTLLAVLAGLVRPDEGSVARPDGTTQGLVLQTHGLVAVLSAIENVELALQLQGVLRTEIGARARRALARVGLDSHLDRLALELSGGQQQRVGVARALAVTPDLLLADEPTAELDPGSRELVLRSLREEADRGATVVVASHDPEVVDACDTVHHLAEGRLPPGGAQAPQGIDSKGTGAR